MIKLSSSSLLNVDVTNPVVREHGLNVGMVGWWLELPHTASDTRCYDLGGKWHGTVYNPTNSNPVVIPIVGTSRPGGYAAQLHMLDPLLAKKIALPDFSAQFTTEGTFAGWFKRWEATPSGPNAANRVGWCGLGIPANTSLHTLYTWMDNNTYCGIFDSGRPITYNIPNRTSWNHVCVVSRSGSNNYKLYVNGRQAAQATRGTFGMTTAPMFGGATSSSGGQYFDGQADDWRLWNRGLSATEVAALYQESRSGYPTMLRRNSMYVHFAASAAPSATVGGMSNSGITQYAY